MGVWVGGFVRLSSCQMCSEDILLARISSNHLVCVHTASNISTHTLFHSERMYDGMVGGILLK